MKQLLGKHPNAAKKAIKKLKRLVVSDDEEGKREEGEEEEEEEFVTLRKVCYVLTYKRSTQGLSKEKERSGQH